MIFEERVDALTTTTDYCWVPTGNNAASSLSPSTCQKQVQQQQQHARANNATTRAMEAAASPATIRRKRTQCEEEEGTGIRRPRRRRRRGVHHGVDELRRALLLHPMTKIQPREQEVATSVATTNDAEASRSLGDLSCLHDNLLLDALAFCCARDLARVETSCRFARRPNPGLGGRSACEHVAWIQLQQKEVESPPLSLRGSMRRLHLATSRVLLTVLRRRSRTTDQQRHNLAAIGAASAIARNLTAPIAMMQETTAEVLLDYSSSSRSSRTRRLRETDVSSDVVRVRDGIFADASLFHRENGQEEDVERIDVPFEYAKAIGLSMRNTDAALAVGDCVVDSMPDITPISRVRPDGCWVLRTVNGNPCWSPETYRRTLDEAADERDDESSSSPSNLSTTNATTAATTTTTTSKKVDDGDFAQVFDAHLEAGLDAKALVRERLALEEVAAAATAHETKKHPRKNPRRRPPPSVRLEFEHVYDRIELALPLAVSASTAVELARVAFLDSPERLPRQPDGTTAVLFATDEPNCPGRTACWTDADRETTLADYGLHAGNHVTFLLHFLPEMHATPPQG